MKLALAVLAAFAATPAQASYDIPPIEPVYGVSVSKTGIVVRLASNGCTKKPDLTTAVSTAPPRPLVLIARKHADACKGAPGAVEIVWSFEDLGLKPGQPFSLANPLTAEPGN